MAKGRGFVYSTVPGFLFKRVKIPQTKTKQLISSNKPVDRGVRVNKDLLKRLHIGPVDLAQPLRHQPVKLFVRSLLSTAIWKQEVCYF